MLFRSLTMALYETLEAESINGETGEKGAISKWQYLNHKNGYKVEVELLPQKKGLVIKHVEYLVTSEKHQSQVN